MDLCLYPLQFGSANWGLFELLGRGRVVVASDRCYVPEVITHGENGFLCDYDDVASWVARTLEILDHPEQFRAIGETAREVSQRSSIDRVAEQFLGLCERVIAMRTLALTPPRPVNGYCS